MSRLRIAALSEFLSAAQLQACQEIFTAEERDVTRTVRRIEVEVMRPAMAAINERLGQENDPRYLAYAVVYALLNMDARLDAEARS